VSIVSKSSRFTNSKKNHFIILKQTLHYTKKTKVIARITQHFFLKKNKFNAWVQIWAKKNLKQIDLFQRPHLQLEEYENKTQEGIRKTHKHKPWLEAESITI
jgi:hypothetical protein